MTGNELFDEILYYHTSNLSIQQRYNKLYMLLDRVCKLMTNKGTTDFSNLFSRLHYLCEEKDIASKAIEIFRIHGKHIQQHNKCNLTEDDYRYDLKALCEFVSRMSDTPIPDSLRAVIPAQWRKLSEQSYQSELRKKMRVVAVKCDENFIYAYDEEHPTDDPIPIICPKEFGSLPGYLYEGAQLNLLSIKSDEAGVLTPEIIVFEPDYLIDISALAACYTNYGNSPLQYLANKILPQETTFHTLLGNAANQFLDDCVNEKDESPARFEDSIQKAFRNNVMEYCTCQDINQDYFTKARLQFEHIQHTVIQSFPNQSCNIDRNRAILEPSFLCEALGLQGRMDLLQDDGKKLIELKSGKADNYYGEYRSKENHALQMALYKEILYYNLNIPREEVHSFLFYSVYPRLFLERSAKTQIQRAINLRNAIVHNELLIKQGKSKEIIAQLTPDNLNEKNDTSKLWMQWQRPKLTRLLHPLHQMTDLENAYFNQFFTFITREQFLSKTGDNQPDSTRGFSDLWNASVVTKQNNGNILVDLNIKQVEDNEGIELIRLNIPSHEDYFLPNFRHGDIVLLYEKKREEDNATNKQIFRGSIEHIDSKEILFKLRYKQRNTQALSQQSLYAMEHDFIDSSYNKQYQGLYTFITAPSERKDLILGLREPRVSTERKLSGHYLNAQIDNIVLQAKQADDYFLLIGPPGTGKTSVALKSMVEEFYSETDNNILLLSYTNRAVDEICEMLESISYKPDYIRIGSSQSCEEYFRPHLLQNAIASCRNRELIRKTINATRIFVGTTASIMGRTDLFKLKHFHVAIVDEASQILEPQIMGILCAHNDAGQCAIDKFILVGDHKQLPAVVLQSEKDSEVSDPRLQHIELTNCRNSLFERLYHLQLKYPKRGILAMLNRQGRMHPAISAFANQFFYGGKLDIIPVKHQLADIDFHLYPDKGTDPLQYFIANTRTGFFPSHTPSLTDSNKINREEARIVASIVQAVYKLCCMNQMPFQAKERIGIIVPFRNQIALIHQELAKLSIPETDEITIDTVERYQGSQRDIIIYSTTISQLYQLDIISVPVQDDNLWIDRKLNVAITRAKKQLFVTGNPDLLKLNDIYCKFLESMTPYSNTPD